MQPEETSLDVSIVVPAYHEERRLPPTLIDMIDFFDARGDRYEILVVDDGSRDSTIEVAKKVNKLRPVIRIIEQGTNQGKGFAVKCGALEAKGRLVLMADADGATPIQEIIRLEKAIAAGADVAIGSRALHSADTAIQTSFHRRYLGRIFNGIVNFMVLPGIADTQCGFKLFTAKAAQHVFSRQTAKRFSFDVEILFLARRAGLKISEIPINWENVPLSKINLFVDSAQMFWDILKFRWIHRNTE